MDLADFIEANLEALIDDWVEYAMVLNQGKHRLTAVELRNSGAELLTRVAANMRQAQTPLQQRQKSHGAKREQDSAFDTVSMLHADDRLSQGSASMKCWRNTGRCAPACCAGGNTARSPVRRPFRK